MSSCDDFRANDMKDIIVNSCSTLLLLVHMLNRFYVYLLCIDFSRWCVAFVERKIRLSSNLRCTIFQFNGKQKPTTSNECLFFCSNCSLILRLKRIPSTFLFTLLTHPLALLYFIVVQFVIVFRISILSHALCSVSHNFRCVRFFVFRLHSFRLFDYFFVGRTETRLSFKAAIQHVFILPLSACDGFVFFFFIYLFTSFCKIWYHFIVTYIIKYLHRASVCL